VEEVVVAVLAAVSALDVATGGSVSDFVVLVFLLQ
jgi:energy-converting hydrogenase Eha subunit C